MPKTKRLAIDWINGLPFCSKCHLGRISPGIQEGDKNVIRDHCPRCKTLNVIYYKDALPSLQKMADKAMKEFLETKYGKKFQ